MHAPRRLTLGLALGLCAATALAAAPPRALAQDATATETPSTTTTTTTHAAHALTDRPFFVGAGLGIMAGFNGGASFRAVEHFGYRFMGFDLGSNLQLALWAGLQFGQAFGERGFFGLNFDGVFGADLQVWDGGDMQLLVTPMLGLGAVVFGAPDGLGNTSTWGGFHIQFAAQAELVMVDGLLGIWLRPLVFDGFIRDGGFGAYSALAGVTFHF